MHPHSHLASLDTDRVWGQLQSFDLNTLYLPQHHPSQHPFVAVQAVKFDAAQEAIWCADSRGRISAFESHTFNSLVSFTAHHSPINDFVLTPNIGVVSISDSAIRYHSHGGILKAEAQGVELQGLRCLLSPKTESNPLYLIGSTANSLLAFDLRRKMVLQEISLTQGVECMQRTSRGICLGGTRGEICICDDRSYRLEHTLPAHTGSVSSLDAKGDLLVSCGFVKTAPGNPRFVEPQIKVYDLRMMRALRPIPLHGFTPTILKFHPLFSSTVFAVSPSGQFQIIDAQTDMGLQQTVRPTYQAMSLNGDPILSFDISSTAESMCFGDFGGGIAQWGDRPGARINFQSEPIELPNFFPPQPLIKSEGDSPYFPLTSFSSPSIASTIYRSHGKRSPIGGLFSDYWLDPDMPAFETGLPPNDRLLREIAPTLKQSDFVGFAPNTFQRPRNMVEISPYSDPTRRFVSTMSLLGSSSASAQEEQQQGLMGQRSYSTPSFPGATGESTRKGVPERYRFVVRKHPGDSSSKNAQKHQAETTLTGLCNSLPNSYCNPVLFMLYYLTPLRAHMLNHLCGVHSCISCELGFLFHMLNSSGGGAVEGSNLLRSFQRIGKARQMGLIVSQNPPTQSKTPQNAFIERCLKFFLQQLHVEFLSNTPHLLYPTQPQPSSVDIIETMFGCKQQIATQCEVCGTETASTPLVFSHDLIYPPYKAPLPTFASVLKRTMNREYLHRSWCETCSNYQQSFIRQTTISLPNVLCVNANLEHAENTQFWKPTGEVSSRLSSSWLPTRIRFDLSSSDLRIEECSDSATGSNVYELVSVLSHVADHNPRSDSSHYVAHVLVRDSALPSHKKVAPKTKRTGKGAQKSTDPGWYLMNNGSCFSVPESEVLSFNNRWRTPAVLCYSRVKLEQIIPPAPPCNPITEDVWHSVPDPFKTARPQAFYAAPRTYQTPKSIPAAQELVAIDAEYVVTNHLLRDAGDSSFQPGNFALARVSVIHEKDEHGLPILDDYIEAIENVENYLTRFSGIEEGDLDPRVSTHNVLPLKHCYVKLRNLVDRGVIFVGHGLQQDFQIINLYVPPAQIIDTVNLFHIRDQRNIKLAFLTSTLLGTAIQLNNHCSIEDARSALQIYRKYQELIKENRLTEVLHELYRMGRALNWNLPSTESPSLKIPSRD